jgi:hypothetical protein
MRKSPLAALALVVPATLAFAGASPSPARAQEASMDSFPLQQANIDQLAARMVERGLVAAGDKVWVQTGGDGEDEVNRH